MTSLWTTLLDDFQQAVKEKKYSKVPYDHWREMKKRDGWITYTRDIVKQEIKAIFEFYEDAKEEIIFTLDYPFGQFLWDKFDKARDDSLNSAVSKMKDSFYTLATTAKTAAANVSNTIKDSYNYAYGYLDTTTPTFKMTNNILINNKTIDEIIDEAVGNSFGNRKENDNMTNLFKGFDFGSCANERVKVSVYGIAVQNAAGTWVSYDAATGNIMDVDILNIDGKYLYKMPVAIKDIKEGDTVIHNRKPMFVSKIEDGKILAVDPAAGEEKIIMLTKSPFGFDFAVKVVNLFSGLMGNAAADSPFGNMLPLMLMSEGKNDDMLPLMFLMNGGRMDMSNPMMLYFLTKGKGSNDMLPFLMMTNLCGNKCTCNCDCDHKN